VTFSQSPIVRVAVGRPTWERTSVTGEASAGKPDFLPLDAVPGPDGRLVLADYRVSTDDFTSPNARRLRIWDVATGRITSDVNLDDILAKNDGVRSVPRFTADGRYVDFSTQLGGKFVMVRLRSSDLGLVTTTAAVATYPQGEIDHVPGTSDVVASGPQGLIWEWDMSTGQVVASGKSIDTSSLAGVVANPNGTMVAGWHGISNAEALFDTATLHPIGQPLPISDIGEIGATPRFAADGKHLVGNGQFEAVEWDVDPDSWQAKACLAAGRNLTRDEWLQYLPDEPYRPTCDRWPPGQ
jgi:hypothetical protein